MVNEEKKFKIYGELNLDTDFSVFKLNLDLVIRGTILLEVGEERFYVNLPIIENIGIVSGERKLRLKDKFVMYCP